MKALNKAMLIGRLGRDPEIRSTPSGVKVASFSMATDFNVKNRETGEWDTRTEWHNIKAWRYLAENAERNLHKGSLVYVEGRITYDSYNDKEGNKRYKTEIIANELISLEKREGGASGEDVYTPPPQSSSGSSDQSGGGDQDDGDIPF
ncbi:MAG: single-stranded DNA-binding protein [Candidatus Delongbacteria bacterium]|nr:single-stranded DNA-binding protein [Candidatus Delongbacteria bacterium]